MGTDGDEVRPPAWPALLVVLGVSAAPHLAFLAENLDRGIDMREVVAWWAAASAVSAAPVLLLIARSRRDAAMRTAVVVAVLVWCFFNYDALRGAMVRVGVRHSHELVWGALASTLALTAIVASRGRALRIFAVMTSGLLLVANGTLLGVTRMDSSSSSPMSAEAEATAAARTPDVWLLLTDGYARPDVLRTTTGLGVAPFVDELQDRGFQVPTASTANYPLTFLSTASMFETAYVAEDGDTWTTTTPYHAIMNGDNATVQRLRAEGYTFALSPAPLWTGSACMGFEDVCLDTAPGLSPTGLALAGRTPLGAWVANSRMRGRAVHAKDPSARVREALDADLAHPHFVYAHVIAPHPPFLLDGDCDERPDVPLDLAAPDHPDLYADAVRCLNSQLLTAVDMIIDADPAALIIIQSDHGSATTFDLHGEPAPYPDERYAIFSAIRMPSGCAVEVPDDITPVNVFRLVFACVSGRAPDLVENRAFNAHYEDGRLSTR